MHPLFFAGTLIAASAANDWPQFRGPQRDGVARGESVAKQWPESGPTEHWRRPFGSGFSSVAAVGPWLYTMSAEGETEDVLRLDAASGETQWRTPLGPRFEEEFGDGPRATPTVTAEALYAITSQSVLAALALEDGEVIWKVDLVAEFGAAPARFGYGSSPLVDGDLLLVEVGGEGAGVVAFQRHTGGVLWRALEGSANATSPIVVELGGVRQYVLSRRTGPQTVGLSTEGEVLWTHESAEDVIALPHFVPPNRFFTSSAQRGPGGVMFRVHAQDGTFGTELDWVNRRMRVHFNDAVLVGEHLFGFDNATLRCVAVKDGSLCWSQRGFGKGSLVACEDRLFVLGDQGMLALVEATPEDYREWGRVQALQDRCWTSPSLSDGRLYVRNLDTLACYDVSSVELRPPRSLATGGPGDAESAETEAPATVEELIERYAAARGGREQWEAVQSLELRGSFSAFSQSAPFLWRKGRNDRYRIDHRMIGQAAARGRDAEGAWWQMHLFGVQEPARVEIAEYGVQLAREAWFEPPLLNAGPNGVTADWLGPGNIDGRPTYGVKLTFADESVETWHLDATTFLEIAVDARVADFTQTREIMDQRTFYSDFRQVGGLVIPFHRAAEFGARLEEWVVDEVIVDPELPANPWAMPVEAVGDGN